MLCLSVFWWVTKILFARPNFAFQDGRRILRRFIQSSKEKKMASLDKPVGQRVAFGADPKSVFSDVKTGNNKNNNEDELIEVREVRICDLSFPGRQISDLHRNNNVLLLEFVSSKTGLAQKIHEAIYQIFSLTPRRHRRLAIEDDEFFHSEKVRRLEQNRKYSRDGTRFNKPIPQRKKNISDLLNPTALPNQKRIRFTTKVITNNNDTSSTQKSNVKRGADVGREVPFPGSIPVSMMEGDIRKLLYDGAYYFEWAPKTNGLRFFAVGCTFGGTPMLLLINRSQQIYLVPNVSAPDLLFSGTILDGELVPTKHGSFAYIAYDCAMSCGVPCSEYNYLIRLQTAGLLVESWNKTISSEKKSSGPAGTTSGTFGIEWRVKRVYAKEKFYEMLILELPTLDHDTDGFMATAVEPPIQMGQTPTIFKVKRSTDHTIDFLANVVLKSADRILVDLVAMHNRGVNQPAAGVLWDTITLQPKDLPMIAQHLGVASAIAHDVGQWLNGQIVECRYNLQTKSWDFEHLRKDKEVPNKIATAEKTWKNIQENLSLLQIFPEGALPEHTRKLIGLWETQHPDWKPSSLSTSSSSLSLPTTAVSTVATATAPAPLSKLVQFT
jgi:hypothetical protein